MSARTMSSSPAGDHLTWRSCTRRRRRASAPYNTKVTLPCPGQCCSQLLGVRGLGQHTVLVSSRKTETEQGWLGPWRHPEHPGEPCAQLCPALPFWLSFWHAWLWASLDWFLLYVEEHKLNDPRQLVQACSIWYLLSAG